ncbi:hypothetical protein [Hippea alviniae]|uniref:hypothetical protein n=1 Tax=Hippea alviniae TaxID=1279027 RepID=UPI0003B58806|nr:hypothetical protein [Hippea alviniae]
MEIERYSSLIDDIRKLPLKEKENLKSLIEKYIAEEKRCHDKPKRDLGKVLLLDKISIDTRKWKFKRDEIYDR